MFRIKTQKEVNTLTADERKDYDKALKMFVDQWKVTHPNGKEVTARIVKLANKPTLMNGSYVFAIHLHSDDSDFNTAVPGGMLLRPAQNGDIIASNAGFANFIHMSVTTMGQSNKGSFRFQLTLRVAGEEYKTRTGEVRKYKSTYFAQDGFEYLPSPAVGAVVASDARKAREAIWKEMINFDYAAPKTDAVVEPDDVEVAV